MKFKIIVADDEAPIRLVVQKALGMQTYEYLEASNGFDVINQMEAAEESGRPVDLIILDMLMPGCSGMQVLQYLSSCTQPPKVLVITGSLDIHEVRKCRQPKPVGFLQKPFKMSEIVNEVQRLLSSACERSEPR